jgi:hypothetical protein
MVQVTCKGNPMTLDTPATLKALAKTNNIAKARKLALSTVYREARSASSLEALRATIDSVLAELATAEHNIVTQ